MIDWNGTVRQVAESLSVRRATRDFTDVGVRRLAGSLRDIKGRAEAVLEKLDDLQFDEDGRRITLAEARGTELDDGASISYHLEMIEQATGAFRHLVYEADYTNDIPDPDDDGREASRWRRAAAGADREPTVSFDFDDVLHYAPDGNPIDFWRPESYVPRERYVAELRSLSSNHRVIVVSHRDPGMEDVVYGFAGMHDLRIDGVFCVGVRGSKQRVLEDEGASVHYDDSPYMESELRESGVELVKVPRTAINDLTWVPDDMWDEFPEIYRAYAERVGVTPP